MINIDFSITVGQVQKGVSIFRQLRINAKNKFKQLFLKVQHFATNFNLTIFQPKITKRLTNQ